MPGRRALLGVAAAALAAALPYAGGGPVWDDHTLLLGRLAGLDVAGIARLWSEPVGGGSAGAAYFRPLSTTLLALLSRGGVDPVHLAAAVAHAASAVLLAALLRSFAAALVFAVHPLAGEVLGWASAFPDALAVLLGLAAAGAARRNAGLGGAVALLALLSKESALALAPLAVLAAGPRRAVGAWGPALVAAGLLRLAAGVGPPLAPRWALLPDALLWPLSSLVAPWPATAVRDLWCAPAWTRPVGLAVAAALGLAARYSARARAGLAVVALALLAALPAALGQHMAAERYAYPALAGIAAALAPGLDRLRARARAGALAALVLASLLLHAARAPDWRDDLSLFAAATRALPRSAFAWHLRGEALARAGRFGEAADAFRRALEGAHPLAADRERLIAALVLAGRADDAVAVARSGPREGLGAGTLAWWARAEAEAGDPERARALLAPLRRPDGSWDGPPWVGSLAAELGAP